MNNLDFFRSNPFAELAHWQRNFGRFFDDYSGARALEEMNKKYTFNPSCEVQENKTEYTMKFDLPGIPKDQIKIELDNNRLTVSGERKEEKTEGKKDDKKHVSEVFYGSFMRSFTLPEAVDAEKVTANYDNGVLTVKVAKADGFKTRQITIK